MTGTKHLLRMFFNLAISDYKKALNLQKIK